MRRKRARGVGERGKTVVRGCGLRKQRCSGKSEAALHRGGPHKSPLPGNIFLSQSAPRSDPAFTAPITLARLRVLCGWAACPLGLRPWIYSGVNSPASGRAKLRVCFRRMSAVRWSLPLMRLRCFPDKLSAVHCFSELLGSTRSFSYLNFPHRPAAGAAGGNQRRESCTHPRAMSALVLSPRFPLTSPGSTPPRIPCLDRIRDPISNQ